MSEQSRSGSGKKRATRKVVGKRKARASAKESSPRVDADPVVASLKRMGTKRTRDGMARYGIPSDKAFGVTMAGIQGLAKRLGRDHELALELWETGWYEARMLTAYVDDPAQVTSAQMDRWAKDFDSWAICDTLCFALFDRTPHAWRKLEPWSRKKDEFAKRAAFALLASLALHDKDTGDEPFLRGLELIEGAATDERNFVKKGVNWALRAIGRRNAVLHAKALALARKLSASTDAAARWVGKDAVRELERVGPRSRKKPLGDSAASGA